MENGKPLTGAGSICDYLTGYVIIQKREIIDIEGQVETAMDKREIRSKKATIRQEIKSRVQAELDSNKATIKSRIKRENLTIEEKREKYRQEVHEEKLRLMAVAKEEFRARKQMLGLSPEQDVYERPQVEPPPLPEEALYQPKEYEMFEEPDLLEEYDHINIEDEVAPEDAFVITDADENDDDTLSAYEGPISEGDALPPEAMPYGREPVAEVVAAPIMEEEESYEAKSLFYYIGNLIFHPAQTMDEFDDYLNSPGGLGKVILFYFISLLPMGIFLAVSKNAFGEMPGGSLLTLVGAKTYLNTGILMGLGSTVFNLLLYSFSIAAVNYFVKHDAKVLTLTLYFAFVRSVTIIVVFSLLIIAVAAISAVAASPQVDGIIVLLFIVSFVWVLALDILVLVNVYGYSLFTALLLSLPLTVGVAYAGDILRSVIA